jgi:hypothetical protein
VPALWWYELRNVLVTGKRSGRLTEWETARFLQDLPASPSLAIERRAKPAC